MEGAAGALVEFLQPLGRQCGMTVGSMGLNHGSLEISQLSLGNLASVLSLSLLIC